MIIGLAIGWFSGRFHWTAFGVPFLVIAFCRSATSFRNRNINMLLQLPSQREDPSFIMGLNGEVILSTGKTSELFGRFSVRNISDFVGADGFKKIMKNMHIECSEREDAGVVEVYSPTSLK